MNKKYISIAVVCGTLLVAPLVSGAQYDYSASGQAESGVAARSTTEPESREGSQAVDANTGTAASADYFIKFDGVEGESTKSSTDDSATLEVKVNAASSMRATTTTKGQPKYEDIKASNDGEEKKGNVEYGWKVEEGEKSGEGDDDNLVSISAVEIRGWDDTKKKEFLATVRTHAEVRSEQDLENFARGVMLENQAMEEIAFNYEKIKLKYESEGKLFGFIPVSFKKDVEIDLAEEDVAARVKVKFPWYRFMMRVDVPADELEGAIGEGMSDVLAGATTTAQLSLEARVTIMAKMMNTVSNVLKTKHDTVKNSISNVR